MLISLLCFFDDTATADDDTDGHTLSLHDARPISAMREEPGARLAHAERRLQPVADRMIDEEGVGARKGCDVAVRPVHQVAVEQDHRSGLAGRRDDRSEEHTSELQSLMRISYAVFCMTKKHTKYPR